MWFVSPLDSQAYNLDDLGECGAPDEHFLAFVKQFVRLKPEQESRKWGAISRCEILNWIAQHGLPGKQPKFYKSKREAQISVLASQNAENFGPQGQTEISDEPPDDAA